MSFWKIYLVEPNVGILILGYFRPMVSTFYLIMFKDTVSCQSTCIVSVYSTLEFITLPDMWNCKSTFWGKQSPQISQGNVVCWCSWTSWICRSTFFKQAKSQSEHLNGLSLSWTALISVTSVLELEGAELIKTQYHLTRTTFPRTK